MWILYAGCDEPTCAAALKFTALWYFQPLSSIKHFVGRIKWVKHHHVKGPVIHFLSLFIGKEKKEYCPHKYMVIIMQVRLPTNWCIFMHFVYLWINSKAPPALIQWLRWTVPFFLIMFYVGEERRTHRHLCAVESNFNSYLHLQTEHVKDHTYVLDSSTWKIDYSLCARSSFVAPEILFILVHNYMFLPLVCNKDHQGCLLSFIVPSIYIQIELISRRYSVTWNNKSPQKLNNPFMKTCDIKVKKITQVTWKFYLSTMKIYVYFVTSHLC